MFATRCSFADLRKRALHTFFHPLWTGSRMLFLAVPPSPRKEKKKKRKKDVSRAFSFRIHLGAYGIPTRSSSLARGEKRRPEGFCLFSLNPRHPYSFEVVSFPPVFLARA